jgi:hypothetical protein
LFRKPMRGSPSTWLDLFLGLVEGAQIDRWVRLVAGEDLRVEAFPVGKMAGDAEAVILLPV